MTTPTDGSINPVTGMTEEALDALMEGEMLPYDGDEVGATLDLIARLQSDEPTDDAAVIAEAHRLFPAAHQWPAREKYRAINMGRIPDEPDTDEDDWDLPDDLAS